MKNGPKDPDLQVLCGVTVDPACTIAVEMAPRVTIQDLLTLFHRPTATLSDPDAPPIQNRYVTLTILNGIPVVATHTEHHNEAHLIAVRPAYRIEAETLLNRLLKKLTWSQIVEALEEGMSPTVLHWEEAQLRIGGASLEGVQLSLAVTAITDQ